MKPSTKKVFAAVAAALKVEVIESLPTASGGGLYVPGFTGGVLLTVPKQSDAGDLCFVMLYCDTYTDSRKKPVECVRGMTGFKHGAGRWYDFDRLGVDDSWYPADGWGKSAKLSVTKIVGKMITEMLRAEERYAAHVRREAEGKKVNFGPTARTLMPDEIERYKQTIKAGKSFELNPSGFGVGYRFYSKKVGQRGGLFGQAKPASAEARALLEAPALVYDETDHD